MAGFNVPQGLLVQVIETSTDACIHINTLANTGRAISFQPPAHSAVASLVHHAIP